jgi:hypothetical protein
MIYQFKDGILDGEETDIQEIPFGGFYRYPIPPTQHFAPNDDQSFETYYREAIYRVTDIGEMTFEHYK